MKPNNNKTHPIAEPQERSPLRHQNPHTHTTECKCNRRRVCVTNLWRGKITPLSRARRCFASVLQILSSSSKKKQNKKQTTSKLPPHTSRTAASDQDDHRERETVAEASITQRSMQAQHTSSAQHPERDPKCQGHSPFGGLRKGQSCVCVCVCVFVRSIAVLYLPRRTALGALQLLFVFGCFFFFYFARLASSSALITPHKPEAPENDRAGMFGAQLWGTSAVSSCSN